EGGNWSVVERYVRNQGKPREDLRQFNPHWVWQHERRDSPFYPSATLYRQPAFMQWTPVLEAVARDLRALAGAGGAW
ncbi:MAG: hypothetical protein VB131_10230, partial [Burkholderia gladioli]